MNASDAAHAELSLRRFPAASTLHPVTQDAPPCDENVMKEDSYWFSFFLSLSTTGAFFRPNESTLCCYPFE
jgi:hypothetical protein